MYAARPRFCFIEQNGSNGIGVVRIVELYHYSGVNPTAPTHLFTIFRCVPDE